MSRRTKLCRGCREPTPERRCYEGPVCPHGPNGEGDEPPAAPKPDMAKPAARRSAKPTPPAG